MMTSPEFTASLFIGAHKTATTRIWSLAESDQSR
jgi:hypothetical protein